VPELRAYRAAGPARPRGIVGGIEKPSRRGFVAVRGGRRAVQQADAADEAQGGTRTAR
jgi:hypothetical protein